MSSIYDTEPIKKYKDIIHRMMPFLVPELSKYELEKALNYSIQKRFKNHKASLVNNYERTREETNMLELTDMIMTRKPIIPSSGCLFARHGERPNPFIQMIKEFGDIRTAFKNEMKKYSKGTELYKKYNQLQKVAKVHTNSIYGCSGNSTSIFYNINVATSITRQGRSFISASIMFFESFLANNVKFGSFDDVISFIDNTMSEANSRKFNDREIITHDIPAEQVYFKLLSNCGYNWTANMAEANMLWQIVNRLPQTELNRIYYKNNLFEFFENPVPMNIMVDILKTLDIPFLDPNDPPKNIQDKLSYLSNLLKEYVYYQYQIIDKVDRVETMPRDVVLITDTDSCIISTEAWYHYILDKIKNIDMKIRYTEVEKSEILTTGKLSDIKVSPTVQKYDFLNDKIIEQQRLLNPVKIIPQDGLRHSIINVLAYCIFHTLNDYMERFCNINNSNDPVHHPDCLMSMKNEFLFKRLILTGVKKNYVTYQERQENKLVPPEEALDIKGLAMNKTGVPDSTTKQLSDILYDDILNADKIDPMEIVGKLAIMEKKIVNAIQNGSVEYFKPARIKSTSAYETPMRIQGIKAAVVYNKCKNADEPMINLEEKNSVLIIKTKIDKNSIETSKLKVNNPDKYEAMKTLMADKDSFHGEITSIAIPFDHKIPNWLIEFIDYQTIVKDNISAFPIESIGMSKLNSNSAYSGILQL